MAINITDTGYNGEGSPWMIAKATIGLDTVDEGAIMVQDGIKYKFTIKRMAIDNIVQHRSTTPISQGSIDVTGNVIEPKSYECFTTWNPAVIEAYWDAYQLPNRLIDEALPATFESFLITEYLNKLQEFNEYMIWRGRTAYDPANGGLDPTTKGAPATDSVYMYYNGLIKLLLDDAGTIDVGSVATLNAANIISKMQDTYNLVPYALLNNPKLCFLMNGDTWRIYMNASSALDFKGADISDKAKYSFQGVQIKVLRGMPANTIICTVASPDTDSQFYLGLNSKDDSTSVKVGRTEFFSENFGIQVKLKAAVQFGWSEQVVLYTDITA